MKISSMVINEGNEKKFIDEKAQIESEEVDR